MPEAFRPVGIYSSDLSDEQWKLIFTFIPDASPGGRRRTTDTREVLNAIFYLNRSGCTWRDLPKNFPPWQTVYTYFSSWTRSGVWVRIHDYLNRQARLRVDRREEAGVLIVDSQSAKAHYGEEKGFDGFKKVRGRKRHILVDTLGLIWGVRITKANLSDTKEAVHLVRNYKLSRTVEKVYADKGYMGSFCNAAFAKFGVWPRITSLKVNPKHSHDFQESNLKPKRWIVERTFAWFNHYRRLSKDYEKRIINSESMIRLAMTQLLLRRLLPN